MKHTRLVWRYIRHNLMAGMAYRGAFFLQVFGMMLNNLMLLFFWSVLFSQFPTLNGWALADVVLLYGMVAFGFGGSVVVFGNAAHLAQIVANGDLDYYLALPADPLLHLLISRMSMAGWGDLLFGLALFVIVTPGAGFRLPLFLLLGTSAGLLFTAFRVIVGSFAFWIGQAQNLALQLSTAIITFSIYPIDIFPGIVRVLLYTLIPAAFVGSVPTRLLIAFGWPDLLQLLAITAGFCLLARAIFALGLRRYESGNLVVARG